MNVYFVEATTKEINYKGYDFSNHAVNLACCQKIKKSRFKMYPDNEGIPSLVFSGCDTEWKFKTEEERDLNHQLIMEIGKESRE